MSAEGCCGVVWVVWGYACCLVVRMVQGGVQQESECGEEIECECRVEDGGILMSEGG